MTLMDAIRLITTRNARVYMTEKDQEFITIYYKGYFSITKGRISAEPTSQCDECGMLLCPTDKHVHVHDIGEVEGIVRSWLEDVDRAWLVVNERKYGEADLIDVLM